MLVKCSIIGQAMWRGFQAPESTKKGRNGRFAIPFTAPFSCVKTFRRDAHVNAAEGTRGMPQSVRLTAAQAMVKYIAAQLAEDGAPFIAGFWAIFGHGNVAGQGEALYHAQGDLPTWRGHNEQTMAHAAIAYAKQLGRKRAMMVTSSIGPGALNMVTAAALAHATYIENKKTQRTY